MGDGDEDDTVSDAAKVTVLLHDESKIEDDPSQHAWAKLTPCLDVYLAEDREGNTGIQLTSDEPVVEHVAGATTSSELAH